MAARAEDLIIGIEVNSPAIRLSISTWIAAHLQRHGRIVRIGLALTTGVAWAGAAPPRGWWPMLSLGVAFLTLALHGQGTRERCLFGGLTGAMFYGLTLQWLMDFSVAGYVAMVVLETTLLTTAVALIPAHRSGRWAGGWWALPAALVLLEAIQLRFPLGGSRSLASRRARRTDRSRWPHRSGARSW
ncbi:hypothetical protein [Pengzhenrongella frigida]|uniref:hypothetical protein n=1 Tax=Pengzhenrongella frigida TaxID=1259133 RepID=UPI002695BD0C